MKLRLKFLFISLVFSQTVIYAQIDSSDIVITTVSFEPQTLEDSLTYGIGSLSQLSVEFEIDDITNFAMVRIELIMRASELPEEIVFFSQAYSIAELTEANFIDGNLVQIKLPPMNLIDTYRILIRIEDAIGHQKVSITKHVEI